MEDRQLIQIVDAAAADAARRSGPWLHCRLGCTQCCIGVFTITQLDAARLRDGLVRLTQRDPDRATAVRERAIASRARLMPGFPGDAMTGIVDGSDAAFEDFANDEPCPALDPKTGGCDLYAERPMTCRVFGPPLRTDDGIGVCELNFQGAPEAELLAAVVDTSWSALEAALNQQAQEAAKQCGSTLVAFALLHP
jgi:Fe-S-cluster containining protein